MLDALAWYLVLVLLGISVLPVVTLVCGHLPDRGYALARPVGLMLTAYALWVLATFGVVRNGPAAAAGIAVAIGLVCWIGLRRHIPAMLDALSSRTRYLASLELAFLVAFTAWCVVRSLMPDITATEKPMELAFLNAAIRNPSYPPMDPWMSGFSISYYYFGYVVASVLCQLTGVASSIGFNLMIATLFALTVTGAFSVVYNMVGASGDPGMARQRDRAGILPGVVASAFTVLLCNLTGALELLHSNGLGSPEFWSAIGIKDLSRPYVSGTWRPTEPPDTWWWFRSSRVVATYAADGNARDYTINEFPFFSYLLADLHPHVLALPFVFVALSLALNAALGGITAGPWPPARESRYVFTRVFRFLARYVVVLPLSWVRQNPTSALSVGLVFGALGFTNAWDLPTYLFVLALGHAIGRARATGGSLRLVLGEAVTLGWCGAVLAVALYLPFYVGFRSQTSGIGVVAYRSQLHHFLIFWGPMLFFAVTGLVFAWRHAVASAGDRSRGWRRAWWIVLALSFALLALRLTPLPTATETTLPPALVAVLGLTPQGGRVPVSIPIQAPVLALVLPLLTMAIEALDAAVRGKSRGLTAGESVADERVRPPAIGRSLQPLPIGGVFALALTGTALLLLAGTEFVYIRDLFNNRMNTVFKLYYQAWVLLALGSAFAVYYLASRWLPAARGVAGRMARAAWLVGAILLVAAGSIYAPASLSSRAGSFGGPPTLDGTEHMARSAPGDYEAVRWIWQNVQGRPVIVEATGGSYSQFARISVHTGLPTILGWGFHETQWRGSSEGQDQRKNDIDLIYRSGNRNVVLDLLRAYDVTYVYVGSLEMETYGRPSRAGIDSLATFLEPAYRAGGVIIYRVRR